MPDDAPAWDAARLARGPHADAEKRARVRQMFAAIAPSYDLNNRLHSFGRDQAWRRKAARLAALKADDVVVDVACGTGDLTRAFGARRVLGIDFTFEMLPRAKAKLAAPFMQGDAQALPLADACCDVVSIAFGIRNVQSVPAALAEFRRVLRPGGRVVVLEFSEPTNPVLRALNRFYTGRVMPRTATWLSGDTSGAYRYLPKSVETFVGRAEMVRLLEAAGFARVEQHPMTFGVCVAYVGHVAA